MGNILHLELSTGASGDKLLGALLEVCEAIGVASFEDLKRIGHSLVPGIQLKRSRVSRGGIAATHLEIWEPDAPVRHWSEIREMIESFAAAGGLPPAAAKRALLAFELIAKAEAFVHGQPIDHVHFHEVGAADSILDIVGSCFLLDALAPRVVYATPLALGSGTFTCAHGILPVPAPATARIIASARRVADSDFSDGSDAFCNTEEADNPEDTDDLPARSKMPEMPEISEIPEIPALPVYAGAFEGELTTPTGAALVRSFVTHFAPLPHTTVKAIGHGAGSREIAGAANVVRALLGHATDESPLALEGCIILESNIDHRTPEAMAYICDDLLKRGALDVWQEPITMKKGRLAVKLCLLCTPVDAPRLSELVITATGTLGVRRRYVERIVAPRSYITLETPYGPVPYKVAGFLEPDMPNNWLRPEFDTVSALARLHELDYQLLYDDLLQMGQERFI